MKTAFYMLSLSLIAIVFINFYGCNKKSSIAKIKPDKIEISGDLSKYLQVVDNEYEVTDNWGGNLSIKIKAISPISEYDLKNNDFNISASLLGENGMPVSGTGEFDMEYSSRDKLLSLLKKGSGEEVIQLKTSLGNYKAEEHADKSKKFTVSSTMKIKEKENNPTTTTSSENSTQSDQPDNSSIKNDDNTSDCDQFVKDYEDFADSYIKIIKKYKKNPSDMTILNEYTECMQKATTMQTKANNCSDPKYITKLTNIATKMANALQ